MSPRVARLIPLMALCIPDRMLWIRPEAVSSGEGTGLRGKYALRCFVKIKRLHTIFPLLYGA